MIIEHDRQNLMIKYVVISFMQHQQSDDVFNSSKENSAINVLSQY